MLFSRPVAQLPKIATPTAAEVAVKSKPSPEGKALITPGMTPSEHLHALEKNNCRWTQWTAGAWAAADGRDLWACQGCRWLVRTFHAGDGLLKLTRHG